MSEKQEAETEETSESSVNPVFDNAISAIADLPFSDIKPTADSVELFYKTNIHKMEFMDSYHDACEKLPVTAPQAYFDSVLTVAVWHRMEYQFGVKKSTYDLAYMICKSHEDLIISGKYKPYPNSEFPQDLIDAWKLTLDKKITKGEIPDILPWVIDDGALIMIFSIAFYSAKPLDPAD